MNNSSVANIIINCITVLILGAYIFLLGFAITRVGSYAFQDLSTFGTVFWVAQILLILALLFLSLPLNKWKNYWGSIGRLAITSVLTVMFLFVASLTHWFRI